jgi:phage baseplate assembly protein W
MSNYFDYPFHLDGRGRSAETDDADHVRDLIHQVLFTSPGERVNRPDFGCGLKQLIFMPNSDALATSTQALVHGALQRWLERVIRVESVSVEAVEAQLKVTVVYARRTTGERSTEEFNQSATV